MSIPGKLLIALLSALAVSALAGTLLEQYSLAALFPIAAASSILAVVLSHRALPMPATLEASSTSAPARSKGGDAPRKAAKKPEKKGKSTKPDSKPAGKSTKPPAPGKASADAEQGTVKWFNGTKGFGFIIRENGEEIFVHHRSIQGEGRRSLRDGAAVRFRTVTTDKGPQAEDVEALEE